MNKNVINKNVVPVNVYVNRVLTEIALHTHQTLPKRDVQFMGILTNCYLDIHKKDRISNRLYTD